VKIGILSDIHSNLEALDVIFKRFDTEKAERVYCLGDIVGYGANPNECIERIRTSCHTTVIGNHDDVLTERTGIQYFNSYARAALEWTARILTDENLAFLNSLPYTAELDSLYLVHSTPADPPAWNYILRPDDAERDFAALPNGTIALIGHSHIPARFDDEKGHKSIINVGSVGQPRDRDARASAGLYDTETGTFEWVRESYAVQEAARKIRQANLPEFLAARLFIGM
jgi:diadenosine tetraphosphatase ApaH/serine/threonine PP2A family protein phosphatase